MVAEVGHVFRQKQLSISLASMLLVGVVSLIRKGVYAVVNKEELSLDERLAALEKIIEDQSAVIDGLKTSLADVLAAYSVQHKDIRLARFLEQYRNSNALKESEGGTPRISKSYFRARRDLFTELLREISMSPVFDNFWSQSTFWRKEEAQRAELDKIRKRIEEMVDRG